MVVDDMNNTDSGAKRSKFYKELNGVNDMNDLKSWA